MDRFIWTKLQKNPFLSSEGVNTYDARLLRIRDDCTKEKAMKED